MGFQNVINRQPGVAAEGDFADANKRATVVAMHGAFVTAPAPRSPIVGHFAWGDQSGGKCYGSYCGEPTAKIGFVHRENEAVIVPFLAGSEMLLESGLPVTLFNQGSFWAKFAAGASVGQKVFANYLDGSVYGAAAGAATQVASVTGSIDVTTGVLHVTAVGSGALHVGDVLSGVNIPAGGAAITAQISGTVGGIGTYQTSTTVAAASATITAASSVETGFSVDNASLAGELSKISTWG